AEKITGGVSVIILEGIMLFNDRKLLNSIIPSNIITLTPPVIFSAFDHKLLRKDLNNLVQGNDIYIPHYDYTTHSRVEEKAEKITGGVSVIILEGIMLFNDRKLLKMMDFKVYMDTPADLCFIRRLMRDQNERGRSVESVINQYLETVRPMHIKFIEPSKRKADIIIPDGAQNKTVIDIIYNKVRQLLKKNGVKNG
ncbi:uridine kinase, partial [Francisella tularensis]|uniref:uridine kinase n=1 Tax=Francisella tularensis TaxID=263 RepID=UPI001F2B9766